MEKTEKAGEEEARKKNIVFNWCCTKNHLLRKTFKISNYYLRFNSRGAQCTIFYSILVVLMIFIAFLTSIFFFSRFVSSICRIERLSLLLSISCHAGAALLNQKSTAKGLCIVVVQIIQLYRIKIVLPTDEALAFALTLAISIKYFLFS